MKKDEFTIFAVRSVGWLHDGKPVSIPQNWIFIPAGDPGLTRKLKATGEYWVQVHHRKNRIEAQGIWTDGARVESVKAELVQMRADPAYQRKMESAKRSREAKQDAYAVEFRQAVVDFLAFAPRYQEDAWRLADLVTDLAVPVGSGTVARTERIPLERRAEAAVIAWMRHQTTGYDNMRIARVKGKRRDVRRELAERSRHLLEKYRAGADINPETCPLAKALK